MNCLRKYWLIIALYVAGILMLLLTEPNNLPISLLLLPFMIFFLAFTLSLRSLMYYFGKKTAVAQRKYSLLAAALAAFPILCLLLQSTDKLSLRDFITGLVMLIILWFYVGRLAAT